MSNDVREIKGINLIPNKANFIFKVGIISIFLLNILSIASLATYSLLTPLTKNLPLATLLNSVLTGPGHKQEILTFAEKVNSAQTDNLDETIGANNNYNVFRKDEIVEFEDKSALLSNAQSQERGMFKIPKVVQ